MHTEEQTGGCIRLEHGGGDISQRLAQLVDNRHGTCYSKSLSKMFSRLTALFETKLSPNILYQDIRIKEKGTL